MTETRPSVSHLDTESDCVDRHYGWYTEYLNAPFGELPVDKRPADYVIRTSFFRETKTTQNDENSKRANLVLRFRSVLSHHGRVLGSRVHRRLSGTLCGVERDSNYRMTHNTGVNQHQGLNRSSVNVFSLRPYSSDSYLTGTFHHPDLTEKSLSPVNKYSSIRCATDGQDPEARIINNLLPNCCHFPPPGRGQSLSTGNVCCLFTLHRLPSVEYVNTTKPLTYPLTRRQSAPTPSLRGHAEGNGETCPESKAFRLSLLKQHPCYRDVHCKLGEWVKNTLSQTDETDAGQTTEEGHTGHRAQSKLVRFADETNLSSSTTTLNSLSASSLSSLTANVPSGTSKEPFPVTSASSTGGTRVTCHPLRNRKTHLLESLHDSMRKLKLSKVLDTDTPTLETGPNFSSPASAQNVSHKHNDNNHHTLNSTEGALSGNHHPWWRRKSKKKPPLVTVNVIRDQSEPPEVPSHVLAALNAEAHEPRWNCLVSNPIECANFYKRLAEQRVCLARLSSKNLTHIEAEVHAAPSYPVTSGGNCTVQLRYTMDNWTTYRDSTPLTYLRVDRKLISIYQTLRVEVYVGQLSIDRDEINPNHGVARFEFAVACRQTGQPECWDNNDGDNYVCFADCD